MRKLTLALLLTLMLGSCSDNGCKPVSPAAEESKILAFAATNNLTVTRHSTGMYYQIVNQGSGPAPTMSSRVWVTYVGKRMDGSIFDQSQNPVSFQGLAGLIEGWKVGLPLIQKGGHIRLIVPSSMAYGCVGSQPVIDANSILYFDIQLIDVQ